MGLDMTLYKKTYLGAQYAHNKISGKIEIFKDGKPLSIKLDKVEEIKEEVGSWRKANQIHGWFIKNIQNGVDEGGHSEEFGIEKLYELRALCKKALETKDATLLPPTEGFFFGSGEIDKYYWGDIEQTIEILNRVIPSNAEHFIDGEEDHDVSFVYYSSW